MKILVALSFLILLGCTNTETISTKPPQPNLGVAGNFSDDNFNSQYLKSIDANVKNLMWDTTSSNFFGEE